MCVFSYCSWGSQDSGSCWWTGRPGVLWFMGSKRVRHDWATELNWTDMCVFLCVSDFKYLHNYNLTKASKKHLPDTVQHIPNDPLLREGIMIHYFCQLERASSTATNTVQLDSTPRNAITGKRLSFSTKTFLCKFPTVLFSKLFEKA